MAVMLADAGPTPALSRLNRPAPASVGFPGPGAAPRIGQVPHDGIWRMDKQSLAVGEGYVNERTHLWTPSGELAALGYQVVGRPWLKSSPRPLLPAQLRCGNCSWPLPFGHAGVQGVLAVAQKELCER